MKSDYRFIPDYSPIQMIKAGIFGGIYFNDHKWRKGLPNQFLILIESLDESLWNLSESDKKVNAWQELAGSDQLTWEKSGWINSQDPRGWYQWYIHYYYGRRTDDDSRQISRWRSFKARHGAQFKSRSLANPNKIYPVSRQSLLQWGIKPDKIVPDLLIKVPVSKKVIH